MKKMSVRLLLIVFLFGMLHLPAIQAQEIKETLILSGYLGEVFAFNRQILKHAREMQEQAKPFASRRHRARFRFEPKDEHARTIMVLARKIGSRYKLINGMLYHSDLPNRQLVFRQLLDTVDSMVTFGKRAIRAIKDNNYALYLASAQGAEKEVFAMNELLASLEQAINANIEETDAQKESL
ncbi:MAG: hypothetical protein Kow0029_08270 [Candidatus Rifleibacteriota bacterium]